MSADQSRQPQQDSPRNTLAGRRLQDDRLNHESDRTTKRVFWAASTQVNMTHKAGGRIGRAPAPRQSAVHEQQEPSGGSARQRGSTSDPDALALVVPRSDGHSYTYGRVREGLRAKIRDSLRAIGYPDAPIYIGRLDESPDETDVLVEVTLPDPGDDTWSREMTSKIRAAVRTATSEVMPWAVATTRLVPPAAPNA